MSIQAKKNNRLMWFIIAIVVVFMSAVFVFGKRHQASTQAYAIPSTLKIDGTILNQPRRLKPFHLTRGDGKPFTKNSLKGHWTLMFFGFSNCGYACPTTLSALNQMMTNLQKDLSADVLPQVVMVSVDPDRDTAKRIQSYVQAFNTHFIGVRGPIKPLKQLSNQMNVVFSKLKSTDGNPKHYMINHSAEVMLVDPAANLRAFFSFPHTGVQMTHDYEAIINALGKTV